MAELGGDCIDLTSDSPPPDASAPAPKKARTAPAAAPASDVQTALVGGVRVAAVGLGCLALSVGYPVAPPSASEAAAAVRAAAAAVAPQRLFVDTADVYCHPHTDTHANERLLRTVQTALASAGGAPLALSTKSGMRRLNDESTGWRPGPTSAASVRASILAARAALSPDRPLFLYSLHHADAFAAPGVLEAALRECAACVAEGLVTHVGLCNATVPLLERALRVLPLAAVQNEWSLYQREAEKERPPAAAASSKKGVLRWCAENGVAFIAYAPLGGLKARRGERPALTAHAPALAALAAAKGVSPQAAALAAMLHRGGQIGAQVVLLPGARTAAHAAESAAAAGVRLSDAEAARVMGPM